MSRPRNAGACGVGDHQVVGVFKLERLQNMPARVQRYLRRFVADYTHNGRTGPQARVAIYMTDSDLQDCPASNRTNFVGRFTPAADDWAGWLVDHPWYGNPDNAVPPEDLDAALGGELDDKQHRHWEHQSED